MRKNSIKNNRINGEVQKELSGIIRTELKDPRIHPMTTVTRAIVTADLKYCKAYISVLGTAEESEETLKGLRNAVGFIRSQLAKRINLRNTPEIQFVPDDSIEYGVRMSRRIDEVNADLHAREKAEAEAEAAPELEDTGTETGPEADEDE